MWCFTVLKTENLGRKQRNKKPFSKLIFLSRIEQHLVGFTLNKKTQSVQIIHILSLIAAVLIWLVICFFTFDIFLWFHCTCKKLYQIIFQASGRTKKTCGQQKPITYEDTKPSWWPLNRTVYSRGEWPVYLAVTWWKLENQPKQPWNAWILGVWK